MPESVEAHNGAVGYQLANDAKSPHFDDDPDPHKIKPDPDPRQSERLDENPHESDADLQHCFPVSSVFFVNRGPVPLTNGFGSSSCCFRL
jgi:hypothetical protein